MADVLIVDCGARIDDEGNETREPVEVIEHNYTPEEVAQREADRIASLDGTLRSDRSSIKPDGQDAALVTAWRFSKPGPVTFTVNGQAVDVALTDNAAELEVTALQVGPIEVSANGKTLIIRAEA